MELYIHIGTRVSARVYPLEKRHWVAEPTPGALTNTGHRTWQMEIAGASFPLCVWQDMSVPSLVRMTLLDKQKALWLMQTVVAYCNGTKNPHDT